MHSVRATVALALALAACVGVQQRFPDDVQASLAHTAMRRLETERFIIYYPAHRRAEVDRFLVHAQRCGDALRAAAVIHDGPWRDKMVIAMPDTAFNNAFVFAGTGGYDHVSVIPTSTTLDLATEFGIPPDPGLIACHELTHYVQLEQVAGIWARINAWFGHLYTPQLGLDPWFVEGLATHYESQLTPGVGRPRWPIFTGMFAAAYAGRRVGSGEMSIYGRRAPVGHHYLVGTMFLRFLAERYGEKPLWFTVAKQARAFSGLLFTGSFKAGFGVSFGDLLDEFDAWCKGSFPVRERPAAQRTLAALGGDARYARGRDGTEAWVANDVDAPTRLVVRDRAGATLADIALVDVVPPRTLVQAVPLLVSGLSVTADGREVWLTAIDTGTTYQVPRLLRWRRGDSRLTEVRSGLGPGATISPDGATYYYCEVDGDRWSLAAWDVHRGTRRILVDMPPGSYILGAQVSVDGARLAASVWNGRAFAAWVIDASTGARLAEHGGTGAPIWDASFTDDGRLMYLGEVDRRFQVVVDGQPITDAPYATLAPRSALGTVRFLNRDGWAWTLDEVAAPPPIAPNPTVAPTDASSAGGGAAGVSAESVSAESVSAGGGAAGVSAESTGAKSTRGGGTADGISAESTGAKATRVGGTAAGISAESTGAKATRGGGTAAGVSAESTGAKSTRGGGAAAGISAESAAAESTRGGGTAAGISAESTGAKATRGGGTAAGISAESTGAKATRGGGTAAGISAESIAAGGAGAGGGAAGGTAAGGVPAGTTPGDAAVTPPSAVPAVASDEPYSAWEHLWFPQLRSPILISVSTGLPHVGAVLGGGDRLGMQRWSVAGYGQPPSGEGERFRWGADAAYLNTMLAPWQIFAAAGFIDWVDPVATDDPDVTLDEERRTRDASLSLSRTWRETVTTTLSGVYTDDYDQLPGMPGLRRYLGGPVLSLAWVSGEATAYTGLRRALIATAAGAYYPRALSTFTGDLYDAGGSLGVVAPLPVGRRHVVSLQLRGRALIARDDTDLLQLGGDSGLTELWSGRSVAGEPPGFDTTRFPPNLRFIERLRGYEDHAIATDRAAIADLAWRYPLIIDRGTAATFGFLPSSFIRQLDLELFASAALDQRRDLHAAAGAAVALRIVLLRVPLSVAYQVARRVRDDDALTQLIGLAIGE